MKKSIDDLVTFVSYQIEAGHYGHKTEALEELMLAAMMVEIEAKSLREYTDEVRRDCVTLQDECVRLQYERERLQDEVDDAKPLLRAFFELGEGGDTE